MKRLACQYAIIRFLPYAETGEFANVGIVLACPEVDFLDARLMSTKKTGRITGFFEQLDKQIYRDTLNYFHEELKRVRLMVRHQGSQDAGGLVKQTFAGLTRPREALLRFGDTRVVMAEEPERMLDQLFARMVERDFASKEYHDKLVERGVREVLRKANLRDYFDDGVIGDQDDVHLTVPFARMRGDEVRFAIKPLDLAKDDANKVFDVGGRLLDRIHRLKKRDQLPQGLLVVVKEPGKNEVRALGAADEIEADLRNAGVEIALADNTRAITDFAKAATQH